MRCSEQPEISVSQSHGSCTSGLILHHICNDILREVVLQDQHITYDRLLFQGTVSSIEVKSTCSNSPGPLQVRGCMGAIGGAASNLRQRPHFLMRLRRSRAIPGHQNRSCIREAERRLPWCAASRWQPSIAALRCL